jgi:enoyl-CoA hydratase/carnithine racemase
MTLVQRHDTGPIAHLTLNAPERLNALSLALLVSMRDHLAAIATDPAIRVVVLSGSGKAFSAGHDLREMAAMRAEPDKGAAALAGLFDTCTAVMLSIRDLPQPVIAQVHGTAAAAGCQLVAACDMAVAASGTRFGVNGVNIGLFCSTPMVALTRAIPRKAAFELLTTGRLIDADEALTLGLINRVIAPEALAAETLALAQTVASKLTAAVRIGKRAFHDQADLPLAEAYALTGAVMVANMAREDTAEGITAFTEKRAPRWPQ